MWGELSCVYMCVNKRQSGAKVCQHTLMPANVSQGHCLPVLRLGLKDTVSKETPYRISLREASKEARC